MISILENDKNWIETIRMNFYLQNWQMDDFVSHFTLWESRLNQQ